jgi:hypothetical protein
MRRVRRYNIAAKFLWAAPTRRSSHEGSSSGYHRFQRQPRSRKPSTRRSMASQTHASGPATVAASNDYGAVRMTETPLPMAGSARRAANSRMRNEEAARDTRTGHGAAPCAVWSMSALAAGQLLDAGEKITLRAALRGAVVVEPNRRRQIVCRQTVTHRPRTPKIEAVWGVPRRRPARSGILSDSAR